MNTKMQLKITAAYNKGYYAGRKSNSKKSLSKKAQRSAKKSLSKK